MYKLTFTFVLGTFLSCNAQNVESKFIGMWNGTVKSQHFLVEFEDDYTFKFEFGEGSKPFAGIFYLVPNQNVIAFDNRATKVNEDGVAKYEFYSNKLKLYFIGRNDTTIMTLTKIQR